MIELKHLSKTFETAGGRVDALKDVSLTIPDGDVYGIIGMSGAGKSTLVRCINMLERPTEGEVIVNGQRLDTMTPAQLRAARREITMIFQRFNLLMQRNCLANVCFPMELSGLRGEKKWREQRALELLDIVGLKDKAKAYPAQLSGGQQQRVAIARALATNPKVLLCDEATSALDPKTTRQILELIGDINKKLGITVVIITHQMSVVKEVCNHVAILDDGEVVEEGLVSTVFSAPKSAAARHLVFPRGADIDVSDPQQQRRIRLIFRSAKTTSIPLVARLATDEGISATVISANTQKLSEEVYGSMLLGVPNAQFEQAMDFLKSIENLESKIGLLNSGKEKRKQLSEEKQKYFSEIAKLEAELHSLENAKKDKEGRIDSLEEDLKAFSQIGADLERQIDELLEFSLRKNECIAGKINPYFKHLNSQFLDYTIEGNPVETCKIMCHGINYMDGLNHGDKILCEAQSYADDGPRILCGH